MFHFINKECLQTEGIAIGSKLGCNFTCTYMQKRDEELMKYGRTPMFYKRYTDNDFGLWEHGLEELMRSEEYANRIHLNIKVELH